MRAYTFSVSSNAKSRARAKRRRGLEAALAPVPTSVPRKGGTYNRALGDFIVSCSQSAHANIDRPLGAAENNEARPEVATPTAL